jgi:hypothetical protein
VEGVQPALWLLAAEQNGNDICKQNGREEVILNFSPLCSEKTTKTTLVYYLALYVTVLRPSRLY